MSTSSSLSAQSYFTGSRNRERCKTPSRGSKLETCNARNVAEGSLSIASSNCLVNAIFSNYALFLTARVSIRGKAAIIFIFRPSRLVKFQVQRLGERKISTMIRRFCKCGYIFAIGTSSGDFFLSSRFPLVSRHEFGGQNPCTEIRQFVDDKGPMLREVGEIENRYDDLLIILHRRLLILISNSNSRELHERKDGWSLGFY